MPSFKPLLADEIKRLPAARRLRAPLMGRSITMTSTDNVNINETQLNDIHHDDEKEAIDREKRRYAWTMLNRRKWRNSKGKGPLFG